MEHAFTQQIKAILRKKFGALYEAIYEKSPLLQYLNIKTVSATRGSKARGNFGNIYAVYVLVEDYVEGHFHSGVTTLVMPAHSFRCSLSDSDHFHLAVSYKTMRSITG